MPLNVSILYSPRSVMCISPLSTLIFSQLPANSYESYFGLKKPARTHGVTRRIPWPRADLTPGGRRAKRDGIQVTLQLHKAICELLQHVERPNSSLTLRMSMIPGENWYSTVFFDYQDGPQSAKHIAYIWLSVMSRPSFITYRGAS